GACWHPSKRGYPKIGNLPYVVPLSGYYTRRINGVVFRFEGDKFDRKFDIQELADKHGRDLLDSHEVHLTLKEVLPDVYYLDNISVKAKNNLQNK
ncbi:hypothetical protein, partial [Phocaeicola plebeius]|uniref:hypothetical protein n=1 Tax=Phocaeicola plebeius TaxID=310297 RepID=UPI0026F222C4